MKTVAEYFENLLYWKDETLLLREIILCTGLDETIKWGGPCYTFGKDNVVGLASFKNYAGLWFFQGGLLEDKHGKLINAQENKTKAMLQWKFHSLDEIQNAPIREYILESIENFRQGKKMKHVSQSIDVNIPEIIKNELSNDKTIAVKWGQLSAACRREYVGYINEAKKEETKLSRMEKIKPMILNGKGLNDKYKK